MVSKVMFSSSSDDWSTPQYLYDFLNSVFHFDLDVCANEKNHKCDRYFDKDINGLSQDWSGHRVWCNPPYGREIGKWVKKCHDHDNIAVMLLPARTDTAWFHDHIYHQSEIYFIRGRLKFGGSKNSAPFPSMIVVFHR